MACRWICPVSGSTLSPTAWTTRKKSTMTAREGCALSMFSWSSSNSVLRIVGMQEPDFPCTHERLLRCNFLEDLQRVARQYLIEQTPKSCRCTFAKRWIATTGLMIKQAIKIKLMNMQVQTPELAHFYSCLWEPCFSCLCAAGSICPHPHHEPSSPDFSFAQIRLFLNH